MSDEDKSADDLSWEEHLQELQLATSTLGLELRQRLAVMQQRLAQHARRVREAAAIAASPAEVNNERSSGSPFSSDSFSSFGSDAVDLGERVAELSAAGARGDAGQRSHSFGGGEHVIPVLPFRAKVASFADGEPLGGPGDVLGPRRESSVGVRRNSVALSRVLSVTRSGASSGHAPPSSHSTAASQSRRPSSPFATLVPNISIENSVVALAPRPPPGAGAPPAVTSPPTSERQRLEREVRRLESAVAARRVEVEAARGAGEADGVAEVARAEATLRRRSSIASFRRASVSSVTPQRAPPPPPPAPPLATHHRPSAPVAPPAGFSASDAAGGTTVAPVPPFGPATARQYFDTARRERLVRQLTLAAADGDAAAAVLLGQAKEEQRLFDETCAAMLRVATHDAADVEDAVRRQRERRTAAEATLQPLIEKELQQQQQQLQPPAHVARSSASPLPRRGASPRASAAAAAAAGGGGFSPFESAPDGPSREPSWSGSDAGGGPDDDDADSLAGFGDGVGGTTVFRGADGTLRVSVGTQAGVAPDAALQAEHEAAIARLAIREAAGKAAMAAMLKQLPAFERFDESLEAELRCTACGMPANDVDVFVSWPCGHACCDGPDCTYGRAGLIGGGGGFICCECGMRSFDAPVPNPVVAAVAARAAFKRSGFSALSEAALAIRRAAQTADSKFASSAATALAGTANFAEYVPW